MGRYYKNPDPDFVKPEEFLFKPPWEEIKAGLKFMDETIKETEQKQDEFSTVLGSIKYNAESEVDKALYENVYNQYKSALSEVQDSTVNNPNDWRSQVTRMRRLSNNLKEDLNKGTLSKIQERKQALDAFDANYKSTLDPTVFNKAREYYLNQVNQELASGNYEAQFSKEAVMNKRDLNKEFMEYLKQKLDLPNESSINGYGENGQFMYTKNGSTRSVSRQDIENMYKDFLNADAKPYLEYMTKIGVGNYIKDGEVNMDDRELKSGMEFMGGYNYSQTKSTVDADYSLGAQTAAANARATHEHNLRMKEKETDAKIQAIEEAAKAQQEAAANLSREPQYHMQNTPIRDLAHSVGMEIVTNIKNNPSLTQQAKNKAIDAYFTAILNQGGLKKEVLKGKSPAEVQVIIRKIYGNLTPEGIKGMVNKFSDHVSTIPSLRGLSKTTANVRNRVELNTSRHLQLSLTNTAAIVGDDQDVVKRYQDETRSTYKSLGDVIHKKVQVVRATKGNEKDLKGTGILGQGVLGDIYGGVKDANMTSEALGAKLGSKSNLNFEAGFWMANGKYPVGDPRNVSWAIPGRLNGEDVLVLVDNGPGGIPYGVTKK